MKSLEFAAMIMNGLRNDQVEVWTDVDDFFCRGFLDPIVNDAGTLCLELARLFPGNIGSYYSEDAIPYLDDLIKAFKSNRDEARKAIDDIWAMLKARPPKM